MEQFETFLIGRMNFFIILVTTVTTFLLSYKRVKAFIVKKYRDRKKRQMEYGEMPHMLCEVKSLVFDIDGRLERVEKEIKPNGGGSMKDALRIVRAEIEASFWLNPYPSFRMTTKMGNNLVNEAYCHLCNASSESLLKLGWRSFIEDQDQLDLFIGRWVACANTHSQYSGNLKFINTDNESIGTWTVKLRPLGAIPEADDYLWHGTMIPLDSVAIEVAKKLNIPLI